MNSEHHPNAELYTGTLFGYLGSNISSLWQHFALDARFGAIIPTRRADANGVLGQCYYTFGDEDSFYKTSGAAFKIPELSAVRLNMPAPARFAAGYGMGRNRYYASTGAYETASHRLSFNTAKML